ncbi:MAG TPA: hypothetical protein VFY81_14740 [Gammaproteobacteria bacterium]|nr:hypothetical protein [Gammaproteobacteria bacterium]
MTKLFFRYRLEAVKKKSRWEADLARQDLMQATRLVDQAKAQSDAAEDALHAAEENARRILEAGAGFDPAAYTSMLAYLESQRQVLDRERDTLRRSQRVQQQALAHYQHMDRQCQVLDKHESRKHEQAVEAHLRQWQREADEMCLLRWKHEE